MRHLVVSSILVSIWIENHMAKLGQNRVKINMLILLFRSYQTTLYLNENNETYNNYYKKSSNLFRKNNPILCKKKSNLSDLII
jgi:hypothetical protein